MPLVVGAVLTPAIDDATIPTDAPAVPSDDDEGSSSGDPDELTGGSGAVIAIAREPKVVGIGLDPADAILRSPQRPGDDQSIESDRCLWDGGGAYGRLVGRTDAVARHYYRQRQETLPAAEG